MRPSHARVALVGFVAMGAVGVVVAHTSSADQVAPLPVRSSSDGRNPVELPVLGGAAPAIDADGWLNTDSPTAPQLRGKVVLYDFWTFGCVNCLHTLPFLIAISERYAADGLVVVGVHTPEFAYEADPAAVAEFVADHDITFPVALDPDKRVWRAFDNHYWPAFYLHDRDGDRRYTHVGEGSYDRTEDAIRSLLGVAPDSPRAKVP